MTQGSKVKISVSHMNAVEWVGLSCCLAKAVKLLSKYVPQLHLHLQVLFDHPSFPRSGIFSLMSEPSILITVNMM